ncbi:MAG: hypothetical protein IKE31_08180 [Eubacterium sp.]|nr:hypothetical protein [Eubacterium sp.]
MVKKCERIVKTFYDALEEGRILGRKCTKCGHIEFPPYLACNACGNLDTEWVEMPKKAQMIQLLPSSPAFYDPDFHERAGDYMVAAIQPENADPLGTCLVNVDPSRLSELREKLPLPVKPVIVQEDGYKMVFWELDE